MSLKHFRFWSMLSASVNYTICKILGSKIKSINGVNQSNDVKLNQLMEEIKLME